MVLKDRARSLAHKLLEARSEGERLKAVEEESRRLLLELEREAIERALSLVVGRVLGARWQRKRGATLWACRACGSRRALEVRRKGRVGRSLQSDPSCKVLGCGITALDENDCPLNWTHRGSVVQWIDDSSVHTSPTSQGCSGGGLPVCERGQVPPPSPSSSRSPGSPPSTLQPAAPSAETSFDPSRLPSSSLKSTPQICIDRHRG